ncbi:MAG: class I SAM-dependent methyltransferase [Alphaproteobacteria bacterium]|nr:class I SAM-dependent methyltransferase [Alphaproteobacteria bacterium]
MHDENDDVHIAAALKSIAAVPYMRAGGVSLGSEWSSLRPDEVDAAVHQHLEKVQAAGGNGRVLDLGCAYAARLARYAESGVETIGVDLAEVAEKIDETNAKLKAAGKPPITFIQSDVRKLDPADFQADNFTAIISTQVIHFMNRDDAILFLKFIKEIAKPDTLICISFQVSTTASADPAIIANDKVLWEERLASLQDFQDAGVRPVLGPLQLQHYQPDSVIHIAEKIGLKVHASSVTGFVCSLIASAEDNPIFHSQPKMRAANPVGPSPA